MRGGRKVSTKPACSAIFISRAILKGIFLFFLIFAKANAQASYQIDSIVVDGNPRSIANYAMIEVNLDCQVYFRGDSTVISGQIMLGVEGYTFTTWVYI